MREKRLQTLLYNAIVLLVDETIEQYDDYEEWKEKLLNEIGTTVEELKRIGINIRECWQYE